MQLFVKGWGSSLKRGKERIALKTRRELSTRATAALMNMFERTPRRAQTEGLDQLQLHHHLSIE